MTLHTIVFHCALQHFCAQHDPSIEENLQKVRFSTVFYCITVPSMTLETKERNCNHEALGCFATFDYAAITPQPQQMTGRRNADLGRSPHMFYKAMLLSTGKTR